MTDYKLEPIIVEDFITEPAAINASDPETGEDLLVRVLKVTCPRKGCGGEFWVRLKWKKPRLGVTARSLGRERVVFITRSCPYCFAVSRIPRKYWPKWLKDGYDKAAKDWTDGMERYFALHDATEQHRKRRS
jgi:hypothetical protein